MGDETLAKIQQLQKLRDETIFLESLLIADTRQLGVYTIEFWDRNNPLCVDRQELIHFEIYARAVHRITKKVFLEYFEATRNIVAEYDDRLEQLYYEGQ